MIKVKKGKVKYNGEYHGIGVKMCLPDDIEEILVKKGVAVYTSQAIPDAEEPDDNQSEEPDDNQSEESDDNQSEESDDNQSEESDDNQSEESAVNININMDDLIQPAGAKGKGKSPTKGKGKK
jgi:hypothetical protein